MGVGPALTAMWTEVTRYCESRDGIHWIRPKRGLIDLEGSRGKQHHPPRGPVLPHLLSELDRRPGSFPDSVTTALAGNGQKWVVRVCLLRWMALVRNSKPEPVITYTKEYAFDSQNVSFWSEVEKKVCLLFSPLFEQITSLCLAAPLQTTPHNGPNRCR